MAYRKTTIIAPDYTPIPGGLRIGSQIVVRGRVSQGGEDRFCINLQSGEEDGCDVAFHFNPRNDQQSVVRNSFQGGWMDEETDIDYFPFVTGSKFTVRIIVMPDAYHVLVNNHYFCHFDHRLPYEEVRCLYLSEGGEYYEASVQNQIRMPYVGEFMRGMKTGMAVRVRGFVKDDADRFAINFNCDDSGDTVAFHFNPRPEEEDTVLNTNVGGWGEEERGFDWFPFQRGQFFDVFFLIYHDAFNVFVNDRYFASYGFRVPLQDVQYLEVTGDVELMTVDFDDPVENDSVKPIPSGLEKNDLVSVKGFFYPEGNRFFVNLLNGLDPDSDVALHFNPRRDDGELVLNSRDGGAWEEEERHELPHAMKEKMPFVIEILNKKDKFKIYVNGEKVCSFRSRGNFEEIKGIHASGEAYIHEVKLLRRVDSPFVDKVPKSPEVGNWLSLIGTPDDDEGTQFAINLQSGDSDSYGDEVAMHFNPRFDEECTVRNSYLGGDWGDEEREHSFFPFKPKDRFLVNILVMEDVYRVFVNNHRYIDYPHRVPLDTVTHLMLTGDCDFFEPEFF